MRRNKPQPPIEKLTIDGIAQKGKGVGRTPDGQVVFVKGAIPGDIVSVTVQKKRRRHLEGKVSTSLRPAQTELKLFVIILAFVVVAAGNICLTKRN